MPRGDSSQADADHGRPCAFGAILLTFLLVFVLPRRRSVPSAGEWAPNAPRGA